MIDAYLVLYIQILHQGLGCSSGFVVGVVHNLDWLLHIARLLHGASSCVGRHAVLYAFLTLLLVFLLSWFDVGVRSVSNQRRADTVHQHVLAVQL